MSQYLLSVWHDEDYSLDFDTDDMRRIGPKVGALNAEMEAAGAWVFGNGLMPGSFARVARYDNGEVTVTDGPYAESKELVGGFWVIEAETAEAAQEWARKASAACEGPIELRPFQHE